MHMQDHDQSLPGKFEVSARSCLQALTMVELASWPFAGGVTQLWLKNESCLKWLENHSGEILPQLSYPMEMAKFRKISKFSKMAQKLFL